MRSFLKSRQVKRLSPVSPTLLLLFSFTPRVSAALANQGLTWLISGQIRDPQGQPIPISFVKFLKVGLPVTFLTLTAGFLWLLVRF